MHAVSFGLRPTDEVTLERIYREFDRRGPEPCVAEVIADLRRNNPEFLNMAQKWIASFEDQRIIWYFAMFYRVLIAPIVPDSIRPTISPIPRVTAATREVIVCTIDDDGAERFTKETIDMLERNDPVLLQMVHCVATTPERNGRYLQVMQGFALLYRSLVVQSVAEHTVLH